MAVVVIDDKTVQTPLDAEPNPGLQDCSPVRVSQAGPVLFHAADTIGIVRDQGSITVSLQQVGRVFDRLGPQLRFVPLIAVELEETLWSIRRLGVSDEEHHVEVSDGFDPALVDAAVEVLEPLRALAVTLDREMRRIALSVRGVGEAPEVCPVKSDLGDLGFLLPRGTANSRRGRIRSNAQPGG